MGIGMKELATLAGVSQTTVSLVLNGKADGRIARTKQEKVRELARQYRYRPNLSAKGLREQKQYTIGVAMPMPVNPYYSDMVSHIQEKLARCGYMALFSFWESGTRHPKVNAEIIRDALESIFLHHADGIISWDYHDSLCHERIPTVIYDAKYPGFDAVILDFDYSSQCTLEYLMKLGHTRIGYMGPLEDERRKQLAHHMSVNGLPVRPEWFISSPGTPDGAEKAMSAFLSMKERPSALVAQNDSIAIGILFAAVRSGIRVPEELSVIGFNNTVNAAFTLPPLTTFDPDINRVADLLIELLMERIQHPELPEQTRIIRPELILRESCAPAKTQMKKA